MFTTDEYQRYRRQLILDEVGIAGQKRLKNARILIVGVGGLGCPIALYLAAAGVGTLGLIDGDCVDTTNLHRQILYTADDVNKPKVDIAKERLQAINPHTTVQTYFERLTAHNALDSIKDYDLVVDGTDNFPTRYLVNDACVLAGKPNIYGSISRLEGQVSLLCHADGPCYRCLFPDPPPPDAIQNCAESGVIGVLPGMIGMMQANEVIKHILGMGQSLMGRLLCYDALSSHWSEVKIHKNPECPICSNSRTIESLIEYPDCCDHDAPTITLTELNKHLQNGENIAIIDVREQNSDNKECINDAILIPLEEIHATNPDLVKLRDKKTIVLTCQIGRRSRQAAFQLKRMGFSNVHILSEQCCT